ncbi:hypothetical protein QQ045_004217 [Rhodiola kirilowii]
MKNLSCKRSWMWNERVTAQSYNNGAFNHGVRVFIQTAIANEYIFEGNMMRCSGSICKNNKLKNVQKLESHLFTFRFFFGDYYYWTHYGEETAHASYPAYQHHTNEKDMSSKDQSMRDYEHQFSGPNIHFTDMVHDVAGPSFVHPTPNYVAHEEPNEDADQFYDLFKSSCEPVFEGCTLETQLSISINLL